ncbi:FMN-dependent NADH-azoreductase [Priestia flexa]|uniref:FMN-dependent NADH-azoreductase n=1 Tax=Priestia flexa TaxID=86664 RepID=UPI000954999C|nr:FMN-dependent NADH-azoreductase [Priestia flexa]MBY6087420.1 FMN-dependent NADH-azoreductase [Priestia flexa]SIQ52210.1 FMN-dependent NADH-azoreductase [Priestia flexa]
MTNVLYVKVNPQVDEASFSTRLAQAFLDEYQTVNPSDTVTTVDLYKEGVPLIDSDVLSAWGKSGANQELTEDETVKVERMGALLEQFLQADKVIFSAPMWNLSFPPLMKAYIDNILIAGKTFKYTESGPVGLATGKKVALLEARGGVYSEGPAAELEFTQKYFRTVMGFIGIQDVELVVAEGMAYAPAEADQILANAVEKAKSVAKTF